MRGARPNHRVSWWKNGQQLTHTQTQVSQVSLCSVQCVTSGLCLQSSVDGSLLVTSTLITPDLGDAGAELECRVNTPGLPEVREHTWHLPVQCK